MTSDAASAAVAVLAAGSGSRVGAEVNKVLLPLAGRPVLAWSVLAALQAEEVAMVLVVHRPGEEGAVGAALAPYLGEHEAVLVPGGSTRHGSEDAALRAISGSVATGAIDVVAIHDGARPLATPALFDATIREARAHGGAIPTVALPALAPRDADRVDAADEVSAAGAAARGTLVGVQTPQAFRADALLAAYARARADGFEGTDTAATLERYGELVIRAVPWTATNLKVTFPEDLAAAESLLGADRA